MREEKHRSGRKMRVRIEKRKKIKSEESLAVTPYFKLVLGLM